MPVDNAKQNQHRWWGILTVDYDSSDFKKDQPCVFVKTNWLSHYVTMGTCILKVNKLGTVDAAKQAFRNITALTDHIDKIDRDLDSITSDLQKANLPDNLPIVEIVEIDEANTPPLTLKLNEYTRRLFKREIDPTWLDLNGTRIGKEDVDVARRME